MAELTAAPVKIDGKEAIVMNPHTMHDYSSNGAGDAVAYSVVQANKSVANIVAHSDGRIDSIDALGNTTTKMDPMRAALIQADLKKGDFQALANLGKTLVDHSAGEEHHHGTGTNGQTRSGATHGI